MAEETELQTDLWKKAYLIEFLGGDTPKAFAFSGAHITFVGATISRAIA